MKDDDLQVVRIFMHRFEGEVARSALEAAGIEVMLQHGDIGGMYPGMLGRTRLLVRAEDVQRAEEILDASESK